MSYGPEALDDHVCSCGHPWTDHDAAGCGLLACPCTPEPEPDDQDPAEEHPVTDRDSAVPPADVPVGGLGGRSGTSGHPQGGSEAQSGFRARWVGTKAHIVRPSDLRFTACGMRSSSGDAAAEACVVVEQRCRRTGCREAWGGVR